VTDKKGHFITGLNQSELRAARRRQAAGGGAASSPADQPAAARGHHAGHQQLDPQRFQFEQDSAIEFLLQVLHRNDRAFVEGFDIETTSRRTSPTTSIC
jgi:hypothetical protein